MRKIFALFAALCLLVFFAPFALAQSVVAPSSPLYEIWLIVQPLVVLLVSTVGPALVAWVSYRLVALLKISDENAKKEMEAKVRDALHQAALNGLKYALTKAGLPASGLSGKPSPAILGDALDYVLTKNPETVQQAGVATGDIRQIILSKVPDVIAMVTAAKPAAPRSAK